MFILFMIAIYVIKFTVALVMLLVIAFIVYLVIKYVTRKLKRLIDND